MKKILFSLAFLTCLFTSNLVSASNYKLDNVVVDELFASSEDVTFVLADQVPALTSAPMSSLASGSQTVGGFLIRAFFCGGFALHRYYMGTGGKQLFWYYFCIPVVGGVTGCVDFWWVVFQGNDAMMKFKDNPKFMVWTDN